MGKTATIPEPAPVQIQLGAALQLGDEELFELCRLNPELHIERSAEGNLEIMSPAGGETSHRNSELTFALVAWARGDGRGVAFDSSGGFLLPGGTMRSPDAAWVLASRLAELPAGAKRRFLPLCPDFVVELRSASDSLDALQAKMREYSQAGARLGWLIDPERRAVEVYRPGRPAEVLEDPAEVSAEPELAGFVLELAPLWRSL